MDDPAVVEIYSGTNGAYTMPWQRMTIWWWPSARRRCVACAQKGLAPPGGVQPVRPR